MGKLWVEICLISAHHLPPSSLFKLHWFAVGWIHPHDKYCSTIDTSGSTNPLWKTRFSTSIDVSATGIQDLALQVEVYSREPIFLRESLHGTATVYLKELLGKCKDGNGISRPVEESGTFEIRSSSGKNRGFVDVSVRISAEREESPREVETLSEDSGSIRTSRRAIRNLSQDSGRIQPREIVLAPKQAAETCSEDSERNQPPKFIQTHQQRVETLSEDPGCDQPRKVVLTQQCAVETMSEHPGRIQPQKFIQTRQQRVKTLSEDPGCDQPRKIVLTQRRAVETMSEDSERNQPRKFIQTQRQAIEALSEDSECNQPWKTVLTPQQAVESLSEDPGRNQPRKIILTQRRAVETPSEERRGNQPWKIVPTPRQGVKTLSENPGSNQFQKIALTHRQAANTKSWHEEPESNPAGQEIQDSGKGIYQQPPRNLTPPPPLPPSNLGYIPGFVPRSDDNLPEFSSEALAAAAIIFGDDFTTMRTCRDLVGFERWILVAIFCITKT